MKVNFTISLTLLNYFMRWKYKLLNKSLDKINICLLSLIADNLWEWLPWNFNPIHTQTLSGFWKKIKYWNKQKIKSAQKHSKKKVFFFSIRVLYNGTYYYPREWQSFQNKIKKIVVKITPLPTIKFHKQWIMCCLAEMVDWTKELSYH